MQTQLSFDCPEPIFPKVKIVALGGAGGQVLNRIALPIGWTQLWLDTDLRSLNATVNGGESLTLGLKTTAGFSCGGEIDLGRQAAEENKQDLLKAFEGVNLVVILTALAGGCGSGGIVPVVQAAKASGALVVVFAILPFSFEGTRRISIANQAIANLRSESVGIIPLSNAHLLEGSKGKIALDALALADEWVQNFLEIFTQVFLKPAYKTFDWKDLSSLFGEKFGKTIFGFGKGSGPEADDQALMDLLLCPLLHLPGDASRADRLLLWIRFSPDFPFEVLEEIASKVRNQFSATQDLRLAFAVNNDVKASIELMVLGVIDLQTPIQSIKTTMSVSRKVTSVVKPANSSRPDQKEFDFLADALNERGFFGKTPSQLVDGEDLDVPAYIRQKIRLQV